MPVAQTPSCDNQKCLQFSSVQSLSCVRLCDPMNHSMPGLPVHHQLLEFTQTHVHQVGDAIQPSHPLSSPSPPSPNPSQHQSLFQWVSSLHEVADWSPLPNVPLGTKFPKVENYCSFRFKHLEGKIMPYSLFYSTLLMCRQRSSEGKIMPYSLFYSTLFMCRQRSSSQSYGFSYSHVWMWELDYKESWASKNWRFWTVALEKTLESLLECKEIQLVHPKGNQSWVFIGRTDVEAETPILWPPDAKNWLIWKDPDAGHD